MEIVRIGPEDVAAYKSVRLDALRTDPMSFCSSYEREAALSDEEWERRARSLDGQDRVGFFAVKDGEPCGLVLCFREGDAGELISMWVAPAARRAGLASRLLEAVREWAAARGVATLRLSVTSVNPAGVALYERHGFMRTGKSAPYRNLPDACEVEMSLRVG